MKLVIIESPFAGAVAAHTKYAKSCMMDSLQRGEAPFLSHLLYTQVLDDTKKEERDIGIEAGLAFKKTITTTIVYTDFGISSGMHLGIDRAKELGNEIIYREILRPL
jgi:hypothetical protein